MSNLSGSLGEGVDSGRSGGIFTDTGYGTHSGAGNVASGTEHQTGTGFDEHGQVKSSFGKWDIGYDPVTGAASHPRTDYHFPGMDLGAVTGGMAPGTDVGGMSDVFAPAAGHSTVAIEEDAGAGKGKK